MIRLDAKFAICKLTENNHEGIDEQAEEGLFAHVVSP